MAFEGTCAFFSRNYTIDYIKKKIEIEPYEKKIYYLFDFIFNSIIATLSFVFLTSLPFILINPISWVYYVLITTPSVFIFKIIYVFTNNSITRKIQMFLEEFEELAFRFRWKTKSIEIKNHKKIIISMDFYVKYKLLLLGNCKKNIKKIEYKMNERFWINTDKGIKIIITFKKPTTGEVIFNYRGRNLRRITTLK